MRRLWYQPLIFSSLRRFLTLETIEANQSEAVFVDVELREYHIKNVEIYSFG